MLEKCSGEWKRAMQLYNVRYQIAHGALLSERLEVSSKTQDFFRIRSSSDIAGSGRGGMAAYNSLRCIGVRRPVRRIDDDDNGQG